MTNKTNQGITLMEMIVVVVVIAMVAPGLLELFRNISWRSMRAEAMTQATFYAEQLMEEIVSKRFDENTAGAWSPTLGPESGEAYPNFDDADDFRNYSDVPAPGYTRTVAVVYLNTNIYPGETWQVLASGVSDCKRVTVSVSRGDNLVSNLTLVRIFSAH